MKLIFLSNKSDVVNEDGGCLVIDQNLRIYDQSTSTAIYIYIYIYIYIK